MLSVLALAAWSIYDMHNDYYGENLDECPRPRRTRPPCIGADTECGTCGASGSSNCTVGLIFFATNKYIDFAADLIRSADEHFMDAGVGVVYYVMTNQPFPVMSSGAGREIRRVRVPHRLWPDSSMLRPSEISKNRERLSADFLFVVDADMRFVGRVGREILGRRVGVLHPGFADKTRPQYTYDTNIYSNACVPPTEGARYYAGGFWGGAREEVIGIADTLAKNIDDDRCRGATALWHDESMINRAFIDCPPTVVLTQEYCMDERFIDKRLYPRLLALQKDHKKVRS